MAYYLFVWVWEKKPVFRLTPPGGQQHWLTGAALGLDWSWDRGALQVDVTEASRVYNSHGHSFRPLCSHIISPLLFVLLLYLVLLCLCGGLGGGGLVGCWILLQPWPTGWPAVAATAWPLGLLVLVSAAIAASAVTLPAITMGGVYIHTHITHTHRHLHGKH